MCRDMKDSGIEWIGKIPKEWEVIKLGRLGEFTSSGIDKKVEKNQPKIRIINYTDVYGNKKLILEEKEYMVVTCPAHKVEEHQVNIGDLIFTPSSETIEDIGVSALVNEYLENTAFSYHVLRYKFNKEVAHNYKKYLCNNQYVQNYFSSRATGSIRKTLNREDFRSCIVFLPQLTEQQKIANYLDKKVSQIDDIILKQKSLIEKYKAYKQSLITETVTKGLNKNVPMNDSGVEWIGEIPSHWKVERIKYLIDFNPSYSETLNDDVSVSFAPMECVGNGYMNFKEAKLKDVKGKYTYFADKDIIMAKVTPCFENGNIAIANDLINGVGFGSSELYVFRSKRIDNKFMFYYLRNKIFK